MTADHPRGVLLGPQPHTFGQRETLITDECARLEELVGASDVLFGGLGSTSSTAAWQLSWTPSTARPDT